MWKYSFIFIIGVIFASCQSISNEWQVYRHASSLNDTLSYQAYQYLREHLPEEKWQYWIKNPDFFTKDLNQIVTLQYICRIYTPVTNRPGAYRELEKRLFG